MSADKVAALLDGFTKTKLLSLLKDIVSEFGEPVVKFIESKTSDELNGEVVKPVKKTYEGAEIDLSKYHQRQIALQIQYDGTNYLGFAAQGGEEESDTTVEDRIFFALQKLKLVADRKSCNYSRCGRTDKGVSALGQIISVKVRSAIPKDIAESGIALPIHPGDEIMVEVPADPSSTKKGPKLKKIKEMDYATMLNKSLPDDIRVVGWCEVSPEFSSRFSAAHRGYRYFFMQKERNIEAMKQAASYLIGYHDFRNICKLDVANVSNFKREIFSAEIICYNENASDPTRSVWMLEIKGVAFLWHMVRCIMAVLLMVGEHDEAPEVVKTLLNIEKFPSKPSYRMAPEDPLVLHECGYDNLVISTLPKNLWNLTAHYEALEEWHVVAAMRARNSLQYVRSSVVRACDFKVFVEEIEEKYNKKARGRNEKQKRFSESLPADLTGLQWSQALDTIEKEFQMVPELVPVPYVPLLERKCEESLDEKVNNLSGGKKERLDRHKELSSAAAAEETPNFFKRMRMQGSILKQHPSNEQLQAMDEVESG